MRQHERANQVIFFLITKILLRKEGMGLVCLVTKPFERKPMHHRRDWSKYNRELVNRGEINFWVSPQLLKTWRAKKQKKNGRPYKFEIEGKTATFEFRL